MQRTIFLKRRSASSLCEISEESSDNQCILCNKSQYNLASPAELAFFVDSMDFDGLRLNASLLSQEQVMLVLYPAVDDFGDSALWLLVRLSVNNCLPCLAPRAIDCIVARFRVSYESSTPYRRIRLLKLLHNLFLDFRGTEARRSFVLALGMPEFCARFLSLGKYQFFWLRICDEMMLLRIGDDTLTYLSAALYATLVGDKMFPSAHRYALQFVFENLASFSLGAAAQFVFAYLNAGACIGRRTNQLVIQILTFLAYEELVTQLSEHAPYLDAFICRHVQSSLAARAIELFVAFVDIGIRLDTTAYMIITALLEFYQETLSLALYAIDCVIGAFPGVFEAAAADYLEKLEEAVTNGLIDASDARIQITALSQHLNDKMQVY